ncbi:MAG: SET domain-containing protein [Bacteroidia bacterium]|nr:SET domain-containing protein [Bacteroidia bacterium]
MMCCNGITNYTTFAHLIVNHLFRKLMLVVKKSRIKGAGLGLFTTSPIRKGDVIVEYKGERMTWAQAMKRYNNDITAARYLFHISDKNTVDAQRTMDALARYANDANGPGKTRLKNNAEYAVIKGKPYIIASEKIGAGAEILVDYSGDYWEVMLAEEKEKEENKKGKKTKAGNKKKK